MSERESLTIVKTTHQYAVMPSAPVEQGPVARAVASNLRAVRLARGLRQDELAKRLADLGRPMQTSAISKMEDGKRRVDVDDLLALAVALNVAPARLYLADGGMDDLVPLAPQYAVRGYAAWDWARGEYSLCWEFDPPLSDEQLTQHDLNYLSERPTWVRTEEAPPLAQAVKHLVWASRRLLLSRKGVERGSDVPPSSGIGVSRWLAKAREALRLVDAQLDALADAEGVEPGDELRPAWYVGDTPGDPIPGGPPAAKKPTRSAAPKKGTPRGKR